MNAPPSLAIIHEPAENTRQLFAAPFACHEIDTEGVIRSVNQAECQLLAYQAHELIGHPVWEFVAKEHQQSARDAIAQKIARALPPAIFTREYRRGDGRYIWLEIHERLIENGEREVVGIRSALLDITERVQLGTESRKQSEWMRCVLRSLARPLVTADALGNIDFMNPAAEGMTGWLKHEALGRPLEQVCRIVHDPGDPVDLMSCILAESAMSNPMRKFVIIDRTAATHSVGWIISPIYNDDRVIIGAALIIEKR